MGGFCTPTDESARVLLVKNANIEDKVEFTKLYDIAHLALLIAFLVGLFWMILVQFIPRVMAYVGIIFGSLILLIGAIIVLTDNGKGW